METSQRGSPSPLPGTAPRRRDPASTENGQRSRALLHRLAILHLPQMHQLSRKRLIDPAMATARAELGGDPVAAPADPAPTSADPAAMPAD
jgi:hypothetical protein